MNHITQNWKRKGEKNMLYLAPCIKHLKKWVTDAWKYNLDHQKMHLINTDEKGLKLYIAILHVVGKEYDNMFN